MALPNYLHGLRLSLCTFCVVFGLLGPAWGGASPDILPGCDPEVMDALEAKSWLLGQRRISQNQNLIVKPDSVLEYSCFNQYIGFLASNPGRRFSEMIDHPDWGPIDGINEESLDLALFEMATAPMIAYLAGSFGHTYLGGRMVNVGGAGPGYGEYNCTAMQLVWGIARCRNFFENEDLDGFYDFPRYAAIDPRGYPTNLPACPPVEIIPDALNTAYNDTEDGIVVGQPPPPPPPPGGGGPPGPPPPPGPAPEACTPGGDPYEEFKEHLMLREGYRNCVYRDSRGFLTVGVGHLVLPEDGLSLGECISDAQVSAFLDADARGAWNAAQAQAAAAGITSSCFIIALASVNYQLGTGWRRTFPNTWNMIANGQYCEAADALNGTLWQRQTPVRVRDFQAALRQLAAENGTPCS